LRKHRGLDLVRHAPASRFITLFIGLYTPADGSLRYVNAEQTPPLLRRADGVALWVFDGCCCFAAFS